MSKVVVTSDDWFLANDPGIMKDIKAKSPELYAEMIRQQRKNKPKECMCCIFYYHLKNKDGTIYGGGCTIDNDIMIMDMQERAADCPL